jgi:hypothetical protein
MYRLSLKSDRHNPAVTAGTGHAVFELGRYALARRYLQASVVCQFQRRAERRPSQSHGMRNADGFVSATELGRPAQNETYIEKELTSYWASGVHSSGIGLWLRGGEPTTIGL